MFYSFIYFMREKAEINKPLLIVRQKHFLLVFVVAVIGSQGRANSDLNGCFIYEPRCRSPWV